MLDADELITPRLARLLLEHTQGGPTSADILAIPRLNYSAGKALVHGVGGARSDHQLRFFRKNSMQFSQVLHRFYEPVAGARIKRLPYKPGRAIVHFAKTDVSHMLQGLDRYTEIEVVQWSNRGLPPWSGLLAAMSASIAVYVRRRGWKEGWRGFLELWLRLTYAVVRFGKIRLQVEVGDRSTIEAGYRKAAESLLGEFQSSDWVVKPK